MITDEKVAGRVLKVITEAFDLLFREVVRVPDLPPARVDAISQWFASALRRCFGLRYAEQHLTETLVKVRTTVDSDKMTPPLRLLCDRLQAEIEMLGNPGVN